MTQLFLEGGSPYFMNVNEGVGGCGGTLVPTPQEVIEEDDIPDQVTCAAGTKPYLVGGGVAASTRKEGRGVEGARWQRRGSCRGSAEAAAEAAQRGTRT